MPQPNTKGWVVVRVELGVLNCINVLIYSYSLRFFEDHFEDCWKA